MEIKLRALERPNYFSGKLLSEEDLGVEQDYHNNARRRLTAVLHGHGVVTGLRVTAEGNAVTIEPGLAIDREGREIVVPEPHSMALPSTVATSADVALVCLYYDEVGIDLVPVAGGEPRPLRIRESFRIELGDGAGCVVLAGLRLEADGGIVEVVDDVVEHVHACAEHVASEDRSANQRASLAAKGDGMEPLARIAELLHEAAETHHRVYRITDGADDDWASWYADWLVNLSELPRLLGGNVVRSELVYKLVALEKERAEKDPDGSWEEFYARGLLRHFSTG